MPELRTESNSLREDGCNLQGETLKLCSHRTPVNFANAALFLQLGLSSTLIRHENGALENALRTGGIGNPGLSFSYRWETF